MTHRVRWPKNIKGAKKIQYALKPKVKLTPLVEKPKFIAGVDAAFLDDRIIAVACLYKFPELIPLEDSYVVTEVLFPYIPGFLSFREGPAIIKAIKKLRIKPDVVLFDGQGIAHPNGLGIASHIGVLLNIPSIGCAKSRLVGSYEPPRVKKGQWSSLRCNNKIVGAVLRTKDNTRPVFVSIGHRIDLKSSIEVVLKCSIKYRLPEPLRRADHLSRKVKREGNIKAIRCVEKIPKFC